LDLQSTYNTQLLSFKTALRTIFDKYSSQNSSYGFLKLSQFKDILVCARLKIANEEVDIAYSSNKRKGEACLVFETFVKAMIQIAKR
jgi:hypothetical protein